jgi:hypothetical protein
MKQLFKSPQIAGLVFILSIFTLSCGKESTSGSTSNGASTVLKITGVQQERSTSPVVCKFVVSLDAKAQQPVKVNYTTQDATALANTDYLPVTGTLTINTGEQRGEIAITIKADSTRTDNKEFYVKLDNPVNCKLGNDKATGLIINENGLYLPVDDAGYTTPLTYTGYNLVWQDEFSSPAINTSDWTFESGNNNGWGNNELQHYTNRSQNVFTTGGKLVIEARREGYNGYNYTSTRMITKNKKVFKYGRVDIRAKMPRGQGVWPALWMLGNDIDAVSWPACGEIDILELLGHEPGKIYATCHWGATAASRQSKGSSYTLSTGTFYDKFHVYSLIWKEDSMQVLIDDQQYLSVTAAEAGNAYSFNKDFFFIFNIAVGGNWPGAPDGTTVFPQRMMVDYIRVFQ